MSALSNTPASQNPSAETIKAVQEKYKNIEQKIPHLPVSILSDGGTRLDVSSLRTDNEKMCLQNYLGLWGIEAKFADGRNSGKKFLDIPKQAQSYRFISVSSNIGFRNKNNNIQDTLMKLGGHVLDRVLVLEGLMPPMPVSPSKRNNAQVPSSAAPRRVNSTMRPSM